MRPQDIRHYKFLRRAIEFKYRFPNQSAFETFNYDPYIFRWASNTFYELKLFDYLDIRERSVLVRLYENLKKDPRLKFLDDPDSLKDQGQFKLPESFHAKIASEQSKLSVQVGQTAPLGGAAAQSTQPASGRRPGFHPPTLPFTATVSSVQSEVSKEEAKTETKTETSKPPKANIKLPRISFGAGNVLRNFSSQSQIFLKRNVFGKILTPTRLVTGFTTILGGIAGSVLGPLGTLAGAGAGFLAPSYVKTFGTRHLTRAAHWGADSIVRLSSQTSRFSAGGFGGRSVTGKRVAIAAILLFFGVGALAAFAPLPGQGTPPAAAAPLTPYKPDAGSGILSCPLNEGSITAGGGSKDAGGHCSPGYQTDYPCLDPDTTGRSTAVDLESTDRNIYLPNINNGTVDWTIEDVNTDTSYTIDGQLVDGGYAVIASTKSGGKEYRIRFVHLDLPGVQKGDSKPSGTAVGQYRSRENHVHMTIQENGVYKPGDLYFKICQ